MSIYRPTWLYIKQHNQTGLKYFGKTTRTDPLAYLGSGKYWKRHLAKHGNNVTTMWCYQYDNKQMLKEEALAFSTSHNIVESPEWANLKPETGFDGGCYSQSNETREKISIARSGIPMTEDAKRKSSITKTGVPRDKATIDKIACSNKGKKRSVEQRMKLSNARIGHAVSNETAAKISDALTGRVTGPPSLETRIKQSVAMQGKNAAPKSETHKSNISQAMKGKPWTAARRAAHRNKND